MTTASLKQESSDKNSSVGMYCTDGSLCQMGCRDPMKRECDGLSVSMPVLVAMKRELTALRNDMERAMQATNLPEFRAALGAVPECGSIPDCMMLVPRDDVAWMVKAGDCTVNGTTAEAANYGYGAYSHARKWLQSPSVAPPSTTQRREPSAWMNLKGQLSNFQNEDFNIPLYTFTVTTTTGIVSATQDRRSVQYCDKHGGYGFTRDCRECNQT